ncbi:MAG: MFS transporter [Spirochaetia bacterium]
MKAPEKKSPDVSGYPVAGEIGLKKVFLRREVITIYLASHLALGCVLISIIVLPLYVSHIGGSDFAAGLMGTIFTAAGVIMRLFLGPLADKKGRRFPLRLGAFVFMTAPVLIWASPNLWCMAAARVYQAIGLATYLSSASAYVTDVTPDAYRGTALGAYRMVVTFSMMIGPPVSLFIIHNLGFDAFFVFYTLIGGGAFLGAVTLPKEPAQDYGEEGEFRKIHLQEILLLFKEPKLRSSYVGILFGSAFSGILMTYVSIYVERYTQIPNPAFFFTIYAGLGALSSVAVGRLSDKFGRRVFVLPVMFAIAAGFLLLAFLPRVPWVVFILSAVLTGAGYHAGLAIFISRVVDGADSRMKATALAFQESSIDLGISSGIFFFGILSGIFEFPLLFAGIGILSVLVPFFVLSMDGGKSYTSKPGDVG